MQCSPTWTLYSNTPLMCSFGVYDVGSGTGDMPQLTIAFIGFWTMNLLITSLYAPHQFTHQTELMEETRQYIYTSTLSLTCGSLRPKRGPKVGYNLIALAGSWNQDLLTRIPCGKAGSFQATKRPIYGRGLDIILQHPPHIYAPLESMMWAEETEAVCN